MLCAFLLLAGCAANGDTPGGDGAETVAPVPYIVMLNVDDKLAFICDTNLVVTEYAYDRDLRLEYCLDGSAALCLTEEKALLYIHDDTVERIADNPYFYCMSQDGQQIAFQIETVYSGPSPLEPGLYLYQKQTGQSQLILPEEQGFVRSMVFSPNGQTLAYVTIEPRWDNGRAYLHTYRDGAHALFAEMGLDPIWGTPRLLDLISINDAMDVIYLSNGITLYSMDSDGDIGKKGTYDEIYTERGKWEPYFRLNADHSQLLYYNGGLWLSEQGQKGVKVCGEQLDVVLPARSQCHTDPAAVTWPVADLKQPVFYHPESNLLVMGGVDEFWRFDESGQLSRFAFFDTAGGIFWLDPAGAYLYFKETTGQLYMMDLQNGGEKTLLTEHARDFAVSYDCGTVYYSSMNTLLRCSGRGGSAFEEASLQLELSGIAFSENMALFAIDSRDRNIYQISPDGKASQVLQSAKSFRQYACGMIYITTAEDHYIVRSGELIRLEIKHL